MPSVVPGHALRRAHLLLLLLPLLGALLAAPAAAQEGREPLASEERIRGLIETLEDPAEREELIANLRTLLAAEEQAEPPELAVAEGAVAWLSDEVGRRTGVVQEAVLSVIESLNQVPLLFTWLERQVELPERRALWLGIGLQVVLVLGLAIIAYGLAALALWGVRRRLRDGRPGRFDARAAKLLGWLGVELLPVLAFGVAAYAALAALVPAGPIEVALVPLVNAAVAVRAAVAVLRVLLGPMASGLRPLPLSDGAAAYTFRWTARVVATTVYGTALLETALLLGLPWQEWAFLLHLLYFAVAAMVAVMILHRREPVAAAIARLGEGEERTGLRRLPWQGFAHVWHVLALLYVAAAYLIWALRIPGGFQFLLGATLATIAILLATWAALHSIERLTRREVQVPEEAEEALPGVEEQTNRYLPLIAAAGRVLVGVAALLALLQVWGVDVLGWLGTEAGRTFGRSLLTVLIVGAVTFALWELTSLFLGRAMAAKDAAGNLIHTGRTRTLLTITRSVLLVFFGLIAILLILSELGVNIAPLLAGAGVIGLAIGFGSQKLVQDIITGMFVLLGDTVRVGDIVEVAGKGGLVEAVSMRSVRLRGYDGLVHTIPYSAIDTVTNLTKDFSFYVFDVGVAYREDVNQVMDVLREIGAEMQRDRQFRRLMLEPIEVAGVDRFADSAVIIRARIKTLPLKQWEVGREFNRRMKMRFDELGIEIPFPHQTLYFGADRQGDAPPARVRVQTEATPPEPGSVPVPPPEPDEAAAADGPQPVIGHEAATPSPVGQPAEPTARAAEGRRRPARRSTADRG